MNAVHRAVDYCDSLGRIEVEGVLIDSLIADTGTNHQPGIRLGLAKASQVERNVRTVAIREKRNALFRIEPGGIIVDQKIDRLRTRIDVNRFVASLVPG